jgi:hypothetical protein
MREISRRGFVKLWAIFLLAFTSFTETFFMWACSQSSVVGKILALLPTVEAIANTVANVLVAVDPAIGTIVKTALGVIETSFTLVQNIIKAYQNNIAGMPTTVLNELDAAISAISSQIANIEAQFPTLPALVIAGISAGLGAFQTILTLIASIIPAPTAAQSFPRTFAALSPRGVRFGVEVTAVPSPQDVAKTYNDKVVRAGFPQAKVHVPWAHVIFP